MKDISYKQRSPRLVNPIRNYLVWLVIGVTVVIALLVFFWLDALYSRSSQDVDKVIQERYQAEAKHIVETVATTIESTVPGGIGPELSPIQQETVKRIIRQAKFDGGKGYLYLYDIQGQCIAHGDQPEKEGQNLLGLEDSGGVRVIEELLKAAKQGGGFVKYKWATRERPENFGRAKIGYARMLLGSEWWLGSSVYMEDIHRELALVKAEQDALILKGKILFLVLLVLLMLGVFWVGTQMTRSIVKSMTTLADSVEKERLALAGRLHNFVGGFVIMLKHRLTELSKTHDAQTRALLVNACTDYISDFDDKCQHIENAIYPLDIHRYGLSEVLRAFLGSLEDLSQTVGEYERPSGLTLTHDIQEAPRSTKSHELALYQIAQGLIHNVFKHAAASRCETTLMWHEGVVTLTLSDNGTGFCPETELKKRVDSSSRFGLRWIKAQVEVCVGKITIASSPGSGTTVCVTMPWPPVFENEDSDNRTLS